MPTTGDEPSPHDSAARSDWKRLHLWQIQPIRDALFVLAVLGIFYLGYLLSLVTVPLLLALLLAYLFEPVVCRLGRAGVKRRAAAGGLIGVCAFVLIVPVTLGLVFGLGSAVSFVHRAAENTVLLGQAIDARRSETERDVSRERLPNDSWRRVADELTEMGIGQSIAREIDSVAGEGESDAPDGSQEAGAPTPEDSLLAGVVNEAIDWARTNKGRIGSLAARRGIDLASTAISGITTVGMVGFGLFLTAFFFFFISTGYESVLRFGERLIPEAQRDKTVHLLSQFDQVIAGFVRGRLTIAAIQCVVFSIGYFLIGTPAALLVGFAVGVLSIVPYLALVGIPLAMVLMWLDPADGFRGAWWWILTAPVAWYFIGQALDDYVLTPKIQGESTGLDTPTVLFASLAGGVLAGFYGLLIAIPIAACIKIAIREIVWPRFEQWVEGRAKDPLPLGGDE